MGKLENKTIIVAGSTGRIGSKLVQRLLSSGVNVIGLDIDENSLAKQRQNISTKDSALFIEADITSKISLTNALLKAEEKFGSIDAAVNLTYPKNKDFGKPFWKVSYKDFTENVSLHLGGYFIFMQLCADYALDKGTEFSLVNFSSIYGVMPPRFELYEGTDMTSPVEYAAIKSGIQHLTLYLSKLTKGSSFRVNCISPGGILDEQNEKFLERYKSFSRRKGMLDADDILGTILFLCSDDSKFICGQNIVVDDGFSL